MEISPQDRGVAFDEMFSSSISAKLEDLSVEQEETAETNVLQTKSMIGGIVIAK